MDVPGDRLRRACIAAQKFEIRKRHAAGIAAPALLLDRNNSIGGAVRQRAQEDGPEGAEHRHRRADSQAERHNSRECEDRTFSKMPPSVREVSSHGSHAIEILSGAGSLLRSTSRVV